MYFLEIDNSTQVFLSLIGNFLDLIHIAIPIILIVFVSIDLSKAVISQDDEQISKTVRNIKNRVIAALLVFLVPTFVEVLFSRAFISLNIDQEEYNKILSTYKSVIYSDKIDIQDASKNTEIQSVSKYSITKEENNSEKLENEQSFIELSKILTPILFSKGTSHLLVNSFATDDFSINYDNKSYSIGDGIKLNYETLEASEVTNNGNYIISTITLKRASINGKGNYENIILNYYYLEQENNFKLDSISIEIKEKIADYSKTVENNEKPKEIVSNSKYISNDKTYNYSKLNSLSNNQIKSIYNKNVNNVVIVKTFYNSAIINRTMGFFISNGVVVSSWSFLQSSLMNGQTILVSDIKSNSYKIEGVVAIDIENDIVVLKLNKEVKRAVTFGNKTKLKKNDPVFTITSKTGVGFSNISGIVSSSSDDILSVLPLDKSDAGSPLIDSSGTVVGMNTSKLIESELSNASSIDSLIELKKELDSTKFKNIKTTSLGEVKNKYFYKTKNKEQIQNSISSDVWDSYSSFGDIEKTIALNLVKTSYYDGILSLRYLNETSNYIDNIDYANDFIAKLKEQGYKLVSNSNEKIMYKKGTKKVIIMSEFDYLIIVLVRGHVL